MKKILSVLACSAILTGCASSDSLASKTAYAMGLDSSDVTVTDVSHGFYETTFKANVNGTRFNCSVFGGNVATFGIIPTNPECVAVGGGAKNTKSCNAMLKAAGKC